jgi:hypothetical protein
VQPLGAFAGGEQVGLQRGAGDGRSGCVPGGRWCGLEGVDLVEQVAVPVEEAAVDALLTELKRKSPHVNGDVAVSGVTVTARDRRW